MKKPGDSLFTTPDRDEKLSIEKCRKLLKHNSQLYTDEEVGELRDFLYILAEIEIRIKKIWILENNYQ